MIPATMSRRVRGSLAFLLVLSVSALLGGACAKRTPPPAAAWKTLGPVNIEWITSMDVGVNTYILWVRPGGACWIVDPGLPPYPERILAYVRRHNLSPAAVLLTHGHADHLYGLAEILAAYPKLPVYLAVEEKDCLTDPDKNMSTALQRPFYLEGQTSTDLPAGGELTLDGVKWKILDTSGHSPGGRSFYCAEAKVVITGDALFLGSVGDTEFTGGNPAYLVSNIREHLLTLPPATTVLCGHGRPTTIGKEKKDNPFLQAGQPEKPKEAEAEKAEAKKAKPKKTDQKEKASSGKKKGKKKPKSEDE